MEKEKNPTSKIALLFNSRNNYRLFEDIFFRHTVVDFSDYYIFNIDLGSREEQRENAKQLLENYGIIDIEVNMKDPNIYSASRTMELCMEYIEENNLDIDWLMWYSHDCHMIGNQFMIKLEEKIEENPRFNEEVGMIGFCDYNTVEVGSPIHGRGMLLKGIADKPHRGWYEHMPEEYQKAEYFIVEAPQDNGALFNIKLYKKYIVSDYKYILYNWMDDIAAQFGVNRIASICIPSLEMADLYREKHNFNVSRSLSNNNEFHMDSPQKAKSLTPHWRKKYLYSRPKGHEEQFIKEIDKYRNSIQDHLFNWSVADGPKTLDDLRSNSDLTLSELRGMARARGIKRYSTMNKTELLRSLDTKINPIRVYPYGLMTEKPKEDAVSE
tara:strand:+ start:20896 stop:22041 length:1146 start_codon:yes stop_codon:yes gene_type:complete